MTREFPEGTCQSCGFEGRLGADTLIPVWEDPQEYDGYDPDYIGCTNCHTMLPYETETETIPQEQAERIGELFGEALSNYDDLGAFMLALSNSMTGRSYEWDVDEFETVLTGLVKDEISSTVPYNERWERRLLDDD